MELTKKNIKKTYSFNRSFGHKSDKHSIFKFCHLTKLTELIGKQHAKCRYHRSALESSPKDHQTPTSLSSIKNFKTSIELLECYLIIIESSPRPLKTILHLHDNNNAYWRPAYAIFLSCPKPSLCDIIRKCSHLVYRVK